MLGLPAELLALPHRRIGPSGAVPACDL